MNSISNHLKNLLAEIPPHVKLIAVSKRKSTDEILQAYNAGQRAFGENMVQELAKKYELLPKDVEWHLIGHLQTNKVKYVAPFVTLIHSVDSLKLLEEINKRAAQYHRTIDCLLQIHIASEETKFGLSFQEAESILCSEELKNLKNINITGLMGMATNTSDENAVSREFNALKIFFLHLQPQYPDIKILSMGMSSDYNLAIKEGSNMVRVGSVIFGER